MLPATLGGSVSPILIVLPYPSCPLKLAPQQRTFPLSSSEHVCEPPAATCTTVPPTETSPALAGVSLSPMRIVFAYPSRPSFPLPQQRTLPVVSSAQVCVSFAVICTTGPPTGTSPMLAGLSSSPMFLVLPYPSCPLLARPKQRTAPVTRRAQ